MSIGRLTGDGVELDGAVGGQVEAVPQLAVLGGGVGGALVQEGPAADGEVEAAPGVDLEPGVQGLVVDRHEVRREIVEARGRGVGVAGRELGLDAGQRADGRARRVGVGVVPVADAAVVRRFALGAQRLELVGAQGHLDGVRRARGAQGAVVGDAQRLGGAALGRVTVGRCHGEGGVEHEGVEHEGVLDALVEHEGVEDEGVEDEGVEDEGVLDHVGEDLVLGDVVGLAGVVEAGRGRALVDDELEGVVADELLGVVDVDDRHVGAGGVGAGVGAHLPGGVDHVVDTRVDHEGIEDEWVQDEGVAD